MRVARGSLWRLASEALGFGSVSEYLSRWAWGKRKGQLGLQLRAVWRWWWPVCQHLHVEGTWLPRQPLQPKAPPLIFQALYHLQEFLYDLRETGEKTFPQIPAFLLNHVTLSFPFILLGEGRLGPKPNWCDFSKIFKKNEPSSLIMEPHEANSYLLASLYLKPMGVKWKTALQTMFYKALRFWSTIFQWLMTFSHSKKKNPTPKYIMYSFSHFQP